MDIMAVRKSMTLFNKITVVHGTTANQLKPQFKSYVSLIVNLD